MPIKLWRGLYRTRHFVFVSYGRTKEEAVHCMRSTLKVHAQQTRMPARDGQRWVTDSMAEFRALSDGLEEIRTGAGYRDGERIV